MPFCPFCGTELIDKSKFCSSCGKQLEVKPETKLQRFNRIWAMITLPLGAVAFGYGIISENTLNMLLGVGLLAFSIYELAKNRR